ncbi:MAG TPA: hypothetical protein VH592_24015 [Gemmataceae bacterium]|jgi:hypothetical protein
MQTIRLLQKTDKDGTLSLRIPLSQPDSEFEVVVVIQPKLPANGTTPPTSVDPWERADTIRQRLAATGRDFSDSAQLIREDRDR